MMKCSNKTTRSLLDNSCSGKQSDGCQEKACFKYNSRPHGTAWGRDKNRIFPPKYGKSVLLAPFSLTMQVVAFEV